MCRDAGEPQDRDTELVNPAEQDANTYKILAILNQEHLADTFGEDGTASELSDDTLEFSQAFMDGMRAMTAERFGAEAAERLTTQNNQTNKNNFIHHRPKYVSDTEKAMSQATAPMPSDDAALDADRLSRKRFSRMGRYLSTWPRRVAAVFIVAGLTLGAYQTTVHAFKLPMINFMPEITEEYSKVGTLEDIISNVDTTDYPSTLEKVYVPGVVAEGYEEVERVQEKKFFEIYYEDEERNMYQYYQLTLDNRTFIDTESGDGNIVTLNNHTGFLVEYETNSNLWWFDDQYVYQIVGNLTSEEIVAIAESLCELEE